MVNSECQKYPKAGESERTLQETEGRNGARGVCIWWVEQFASCWDERGLPFLCKDDIQCSASFDKQ